MAYFCGSAGGYLFNCVGVARYARSSCGLVVYHARRDTLLQADANSSAFLPLQITGLIVDFLALGTKIMLRLVGPVLTLLIVQSKGWPFICFWWSICDLIMLGNSRFGHHWLFWQEPIGLFNEQNPSGHVVDSHLYSQILTVVASISAIVAVKRFVIGLYLGRQTFTHYGEKLAQLMNKVLLVSD